MVADLAHTTVGPANEAGGCTTHEGSGKGCGTMCCGFACHAFQPVLGLTFAGPTSRATQRLSVQDEQVESGVPSFIERPPRSV